MRVVVQPNVQSDIPVGLEQGARYVLIGPDGTRAVINDRSDMDFIGFLTEPPSGFDSADTRESADVIPEGDGGVHGDFYLGRRPWTLVGMIDPTAHPATDLDGAGVPLELPVVVNRRIDRLKRASRALRADATLLWTPQGGVPVQLKARRQNVRVTQRLPKTFTLSMVSAEPRIQSQIIHSLAGAGTDPLTIHNAGNIDSPLVITFRGAWTNPFFTNNATGEQLRLNADGGLVMGAGDVGVLDIDGKSLEVNGLNQYGKIAFPASKWWELLAGDNPITATGAGVGASWQIDWRDSWE